MMLIKELQKMRWLQVEDTHCTHLDQVEELQDNDEVICKRHSKGKGFKSPGKLNTRKSADVQSGTEEES